MSKTKDMCSYSNILTRYKGSHDIENHCGYMIGLDIAKSPFVKPI